MVLLFLLDEVMTTFLAEIIIDESLSRKKDWDGVDHAEIHQKPNHFDWIELISTVDAGLSVQ